LSRKGEPEVNWLANEEPFATVTLFYPFTLKTSFSNFWFFILDFIYNFILNLSFIQVKIIYLFIL
jgi:hypothetical protein